MKPLLVSVLALAGCESYAPAPEKPPAPLTDCQRQEALGFVCVSDALPPTATPEEWNAGALAAAETLGCHGAVWQLPGESFLDAVAVYAHDYVPGDCLILQPHHGGPDYYLGWAGQYGGCICAADPREWPGVPVYYLSDDLHSVHL